LWVSEEWGGRMSQIDLRPWWEGKIESLEILLGEAPPLFDFAFEEGEGDRNFYRVPEAWWDKYFHWHIKKEKVLGREVNDDSSAPA
jgi:hypothetical protein